MSAVGFEGLDVRALLDIILQNRVRPAMLSGVYVAADVWDAIAERVPVVRGSSLSCAAGAVHVYRCNALPPGAIVPCDGKGIPLLKPRPHRETSEPLVWRAEYACTPIPAPDDDPIRGGYR